MSSKKYRIVKGEKYHFPGRAFKAVVEVECPGDYERIGKWCGGAEENLKEKDLQFCIQFCQAKIKFVKGELVPLT
jgi:hypothetical protein